MSGEAKPIDFKVYKKQNGLATASDEELKKEIELREFKKQFPLSAFHDRIKPFVKALYKEYNIPRSYIGLAMLSAYSTAVGSAYHIKMNKLGDVYFPVWACLEGISSAGKSIIMDQVFKPHFKLQEEMEDEWREKTADYSDDLKANTPSRDIIYGDAHIPTLIKDIMPNNPKGVLQDADEILSWINGMNQLSKGGKEGTDEQFWMKSWNCRSHRKRLAGNRVFVIKRPFLNVFGGVQPTVMNKLFKNDRGTTGFIFRLLFAVPEKDKIAEPNLLFDMPQEFETIHEKCINSLYKGLPIYDIDTDSKHMLLSNEAIKEYMRWSSVKVKEVNAITEIHKLELYSGIIGKIKEYCLRFAGLLHISDKAYDGMPFMMEEIISKATMERAIQLSDYFFDAACDVSDRVNKKIVASPEVLRFATYVRSGYTYQKMGDIEWPGLLEATRKKRAERIVKEYIIQFPSVFNAQNVTK